MITPIGLDHTEWLGDTIEDIALAKAGIIHPGATVIAAAQEEEAARPILERCAEVGATVAREGAEFGVLRRAVAVGGQVLTLQGLGGVYDEVFLPLHGAHQAQNAAVALAAVEAFLGAGAKRQLDIEAVREGFASTSSPGRLERVRNAPTMLLDGAHNPHGMAATVTALQEEFAFSKLVGGARRTRRQGRRRPAGAAGAGARLARGHPEQLAPGDGRRRAGRAGRGRSSARTGCRWPRRCRTPSRLRSREAE